MNREFEPASPNVGRGVILPVLSKRGGYSAGLEEILMDAALEGRLQAISILAQDNSRGAAFGQAWYAPI
jgi:hypothetical protein